MNDETSVIGSNEKLKPPMRIRLPISGVQSLCLWDTGSAFTLVSEEHFEALLSEPSYTGDTVVSEYKGHTPVSASRNKLVVKGVVRMDVQIKAKPIRLKVLVVSGLSEPYILGRDSIDKFGSWSYSPKAGLIRLGSSIHLPLVECLPAAEVCLCTVESDVVIPPLNSVAIPLKLWLGNTTKTDYMMIEPIDTGLHAIDKVKCSASIVPTKDKVCCYVANHTDSPVHLHKGAIYGHACTVENEPVETVANVSAVQGALGNCSVSKQDRIEFLNENLDLQGACLSEDGLKRLRSLLYEYADCFSIHDTDLGCTPLMEQTINTGNARPIYRKPYHAGPQKRIIIEKEVTKLLNAGMIFPSNGPWSAPICLVKKHNGEYRMCVDYRFINEVIENDAHPLPRTLDLLQSLSGHQLFSSLDLASGFHQVPIEQMDKIKTQFTCFLGTFAYNRMPFGLKVSPAQFSRLINMAMRGILYDKVLAYIDDLLVIGRSEAEHIDNLREVLQRLREADLKLKLKKCSFAKSEVKFLGHQVTGDGISVDPEKVIKIREYPQPRNVKELRTFLGLANYYSMFVTNYAEKVACLNSLLRKYVQYVWTQEHTKSFEMIKEALSSTPVLAHPDNSKDFRLYTDASEKSVGSVLCQLDDETLHEKPIAYHSRKLQPAETRYSNTERELLAVLDSFRHFRSYLWGNKCYVFTDNSAVKCLLNSSNNPPQRLAKFQFELMGQIDFKVQFVAGVKNVVADALSRIPDFSDSAHVDETESTDDLNVDDDTFLTAVVTRSMSKNQQTVADKNNTDINDVMPQVCDMADESVPVLDDLDDSGIPVEPNMLDKVRQAQKNDEFLNAMIQYKLLLSLPTNTRLASRIKTVCEKFALDEQQILRQQDGFADPEAPVWLIVVPKGPLRMELIAYFHGDPLSGGHQGIASTNDRIRQRFWWNTMHKDVGEYIRACDACARNKSYPHPQRTPLHPIETRARFERVATDITGPFEETADGYKYILGFVDLFTKYAITEPIRDMKAITIAEVFVRRVITVFGPPSVLLSDRGADFLSPVVRGVCHIFKTMQSRTASYCPNTNGGCERFWRSLKMMLINYCNLDRNNWDEMLPLVTYCYNTGLRTSTGQTPYELVYGEPPKDPLDNLFFPSKAEFEASPENVQRLVKHLKYVQKAAQQTQNVQNKRMKLRFDKSARRVTFTVGQLVLRKINRVSQGLKKKVLTPFWDGPHRVVYAPPSAPTVVLRLFDDPSGRYDRVPVHHLKLYIRNPVMPVENDVCSLQPELAQEATEGMVVSEKDNKAHGSNAAGDGTAVVPPHLHWPPRSNGAAGNSQPTQKESPLNDYYIPQAEVGLKGDELRIFLQIKSMVKQFPWLPTMHNNVFLAEPFLSDYLRITEERVRYYLELMDQLKDNDISIMQAHTAYGQFENNLQEQSKKKYGFNFARIALPTSWELSADTPADVLRRIHLSQGARIKSLVRQNDITTRRNMQELLNNDLPCTSASLSKPETQTYRSTAGDGTATGAQGASNARDTRNFRDSRVEEEDMQLDEESLLRNANSSFDSLFDAAKNEHQKGRIEARFGRGARVPHAPAPHAPAPPAPALSALMERRQDTAPAGAQAGGGVVRTFYRTPPPFNYNCHYCQEKGHKRDQCQKRIADKMADNGNCHKIRKPRRGRHFYQPPTPYCRNNKPNNFNNQRRRDEDDDASKARRILLNTFSSLSY